MQVLICPWTVENKKLDSGEQETGTARKCNSSIRPQPPLVLAAAAGTGWPVLNAPPPRKMCQDKCVCACALVGFEPVICIFA